MPRWISSGRKTHVRLPALLGRRPGLVVVHGVAATVQVDLPRGLLVPRDCERSSSQHSIPLRVYQKAYW